MLCEVFNRTLRTQNNSQSVTDGGPQCMKEERNLLFRPLQTALYLKCVVKKTTHNGDGNVVRSVQSNTPYSK
jgi:hypothetical protein